MTQPSGIPILSPVLFMHVGDPYILKCEEFLIYLYYCITPPILFLYIHVSVLGWLISCFTATTLFAVIMFIKKHMYTKFIMIGVCLSELHAHLCPYHNVYNTLSLHLVLMCVNEDDTRMI